MPRNTLFSGDVRTRGYILRRTNYGEADRILNIITPEGKISAIAKGVRKPRSKLAGGVEMFTLTDFNIHMGKSEMGVVTGARMLKHYSNVVRDFAKMELMGVVFKKVSTLAESSDSLEYFRIVEQCLAGLDDGAEVELVRGWYDLNILRTMGEEMNLHREAGGEKLMAGVRYEWDIHQEAFLKTVDGVYGENEIKMLRLMMSAELGVVRRVKIDEETLHRVLDLIGVVARARL